LCGYGYCPGIIVTVFSGGTPRGLGWHGGDGGGNPIPMAAGHGSFVSQGSKTFLVGRLVGGGNFAMYAPGTGGAGLGSLTGSLELRTEVVLLGIL